MLDLFDLDETFSSEKVRLAQLTNKCTDDDLEFYVRKCGEILGVTPKLHKDQRDAKHILEHIFFQVVEFKKLNQLFIEKASEGEMSSDDKQREAMDSLVSDLSVMGSFDTLDVDC
ncbi:hypothetical protein FQN60_009652 [Etheostoma spectabile]|uniref:Intraflagellar transport protein 52 C-terminal domain-containing protein n=1 Tax=Etheostoma spectabile TaxID=54343 RepID=A0A5J5DJG7_9PERO|nr:hypothetical protein FQN60_009652 [Etheostoma spectabile]